MIKVQSRSDELAEGKYPQIRVSDTGMLVVFTGTRTGAVLDTGKASEGLYYVGYYSTTWDVNSFKPWRGTITLTQD